MPMITTPALHRRLAALALLGATTLVAGCAGMSNPFGGSSLLVPLHLPLTFYFRNALADILRGVIICRPRVPARRRRVGTWHH